MSGFKKIVILISLGLLLTGCGKKKDEFGGLEESFTTASIESSTEQPIEIIEDSEGVTETQGEPVAVLEEPVINKLDLSTYFENRNGAAVFYNPKNQTYYIYNEELANERRSPCSTFKIISSIAGLEAGVINPDYSLRAWSGEQFWNSDWNRDIGFDEAFRTSCIWYFREVINEIGRDRMKIELELLQYGNCDSSDWEGRENTNNNDRALTGFWVESSLRISPIEQTQVLERIFGDDSYYSEKNLELLKDAMLIDQDTNNYKIYGKTGMGVKNGVTIDAWFVGMVVKESSPVYFSIYLGKSENQDVSSAVAREIAISLIHDYNFD